MTRGFRENISGFLPHKRTMLLVDSFLYYDVENASAAVSVILKKDKPYWDKRGKFQGHWLIEMMAQAVAGLYSKSSEGEGPAKVGFLIAVDHFSCELLPDLYPGDKIEIRCNMEIDMFPVGIYDAQVLIDGKQVAEAKMKFYTSDSEGEEP